MHAGPLHRLDLFARGLLPFVATAALVLVSVVPLRLPGLGPVMPELALIAVYYWAIFLPRLMPVWAVFALGLFQDILSGLPLGLNALLLLAVYGIVSEQRRVFLGKSFAVMWFGFVLVATAAAFAEWLLLVIFNGALMSPVPGATQLLITIGVFPPLTWVFARAQQALTPHG